MRGVCTADWHFQGMKKVLGDQANALQTTEICKAYRYAQEHQIDNVVVPGDISDVPSLEDDTLIALLTTILTYDEHICTHYIPGNHDVHSKERSSLDVIEFLVQQSLFKNFRLYSKTTVRTIEDVDVCFLPYPNKIVRAKKGNDRPPLVFAHMETPGAIGDNGRPLTGHEKIKRHEGDFVISGHIHQYQHLSRKRWIYPGTLFQKNFGEALPKGFIDFEASYKNGRLVVEHDFIVNNPNFVLKVVHIGHDSDFERLEANSNIRYKLIVDKSVVVPKSLTRDFPNIIYIQGASKFNSVDAVEDIGLTFKDVPTFSPTYGLKKYLTNMGFDKAKLKRAREFVREAKAHLGIAS